MMQVIEPTKEQLNDFVIAQHGSLQQSWQWGELQERMQRPVKRYLAMDEAGKPYLTASFVRHDLPLGKFYWLCPKGPVFDRSVILSPAAGGTKNLKLNEILQSLPLLQNDKPIFIRIEPELPPSSKFQVPSSKFLPAPHDHNPRATILIDLTKPEDELLSGMHPKTRYNLRLAQRKELRITNDVSREGWEEFWRLMTATARRDRFHLHPKNYYQELLKMSDIKLFLAYSSQKLFAGAIVSMFGQKATYLHGASDYESRQLMAPHLLHWEIMRSAKAAGMKTYDFGGVAPAYELNHPWAGISRFKTGFGGEYVEYAGSWDYVVDKFWYGVYKFARKIL